MQLFLTTTNILFTTLHISLILKTVTFNVSHFTTIETLNTSTLLILTLTLSCTKYHGRWSTISTVTILRNILKIDSRTSNTTTTLHKTTTGKTTTTRYTLLITTTPRNVLSRLPSLLTNYRNMSWFPRNILTTNRTTTMCTTTILVAASTKTVVWFFINTLINLLSHKYGFTKRGRLLYFYLLLS